MEFQKQDGFTDKLFAVHCTRYPHSLTEIFVLLVLLELKLTNMKRKKGGIIVTTYYILLLQNMKM